MIYNEGAAEYWFYKCLEEGPSLEHKIFLRQFNSPAFLKSYEMYEWATLWYLENLKYSEFFVETPKEFFVQADEIYVGGTDAKNTKGICTSKRRQDRSSRETYH